VSVKGQTRLLVLQFTSADPVKAARIANALADAYIADEMDVRYEATRRATQWLTEKIAELRRNVSESERAVELFRKQAGLLSAGTNSNTLISQQTSELNAQLIVARAARAQAEARLVQVKRLIQASGGAGAAAMCCSPRLFRHFSPVKPRLSAKSPIYPRCTGNVIR
jgi:polysaccharide biosynthesis transport protein